MCAAASRDGEVIKRMYEHLERFSEALLGDQERSRWTSALLVLLALTALLIGVRLAVGSYPVTLFPDDAINALAQGDYLAQGYRPYVDYFSLHGSFPFQFIAAGINVHGISLDAIALAQVVAAALFGVLMWKVAISRLHPFWAVVLAICVELLIISCSPIARRAWREFSPAMWYNTISFSVMAIVFLYVLLPSRSTSALSRWLDTLIVAFCLMVSFHTKMSFFPLVAMVFGVGTILIPRNAEMRTHGLAALAAAAVMIFGYAWMLGGSVTAYLEFLRSVSLKVHPLAFALRFVQYTRTLGLLAVGMLMAGWLAYETGLIRQTRREWILTVLMCGALMAAASTCKQDPESLPLLGVVPLGVTTAVATLAQRNGRRIDHRLAAPVLLISLILVANDAKNSALSLAFSHVTFNTLEPPVERLSSADVEAIDISLSDRVDPRLFTLMPRWWVEDAFSALSLLSQARAAAGEVLYVSTEANGITVLTDLKHTRGESPWAAYSLTRNASDLKPTVEDFLSDADWILRDLSNPMSWENLTHYRGEYVEENFVPVASNDRWTLYQRRAAGHADEGSNSDESP
jgi:hypothetical protein